MLSNSLHISVKQGSYLVPVKPNKRTNKSRNILNLFLEETLMEGNC